MCESVSQINSAVGLVRIFNSLRNVFFEAWRIKKEKRIAAQREFIFVKRCLYRRRFSFQTETSTISNLWCLVWQNRSWHDCQLHVTCCNMRACCCWRRTWSCWGLRTCCWSICCICCGVITWGVIIATDTGTCIGTQNKQMSENHKSSNTVWLLMQEAKSEPSFIPAYSCLKGAKAFPNMH